MKNKKRLLWNERTKSAKIIDEPLKICVFNQLIIDNWHIVGFTPAYIICTMYNIETSLWLNMNIIIDTDNEDFVIFIPEYATLYSFGSFISEFHCWKVWIEFWTPVAVHWAHLIVDCAVFSYFFSLSMESIKAGSCIISSSVQQ